MNANACLLSTDNATQKINIETERSKSPSAKGRHKTMQKPLQAVNHSQ